MILSTCTYRGWWFCAILSVLIARVADGARGSSSHHPDLLPNLRTVRRTLMTGNDKYGSEDGAGSCSSGKCPEDYLPLIDEQCYICTPWDENKIRPTAITVLYIGGTGAISRYQTEDKATCRDQTFPETGTVTTSYGMTYNVVSGQQFTFTGANGEAMDADTTFTFSNGIECSIHTSCSQPLVAGDRLGPFLLLQGNNCSFAYCGDKVVNGNETCDEGDAMPSATCRADCTKPRCGDSILDTNLGEACDEGAAMPSDSCVDCAVPDLIPVCGDGKVDTGEECDDGDCMPTATCRADCTEPRCGDGIVDTGSGEACDEGAAMPSDSCVDCAVPDLIPVCGDGKVDTGEECDEGACMPTATCRQDCTKPMCGDGIVDTGSGEACDEGDAMPSATCRADCTKPNCGNGVVDTDEDCDEGAGMPSANCRADCTIPTCGDGIVDEASGEACDEGDAMPSDTCIDCAIPDTIPVCGNGKVEEGETCDEGAGMPSANCRADCTIPTCGDGIVDEASGEACDEGDAMPSDNCIDCAIPDTIPVCGNGKIEEGEECDMGANNGNMTGTGNCKADCTICQCGANATYDATTGAVTIDFDMCGAKPVKSDFIGIYPCNETTKVADQDWWDNKVCQQFPAACGDFQFGYEEDKVYVGNLYKWFSYTCGSPLEPSQGGCQSKNTTVWPDSGTVTIDPNKNGTVWAFLGGRKLAPGCYKAILQREMYFISPPPYPDICAEGWEGALEFFVPASTAVSPLETGGSAQSGSSSVRSTFFVSLVLMVALYFVNK